MRYRIVFSPVAERDLQFFKSTGQVAIVNKIKRLLLELEEHPYSGTGKPEMLRFDLSGYWSRRITKEHRMVYRVEEREIYVEILAVRGHYR